MYNAVVLASVLALTACSKKKQDDKPAGSGASPAGEAKPTEATPGAPAAATAKLDCDKVLPQALRDTYFADMKIEPIAGIVDYNGKCKLTPPGDNPLTHELDATCHDNVTLAKKQTLEALPKAMPDMQPIRGVEDSLAQDLPGEAGWQFHAYDNDSNCAVMGTLPPGVAGPAFVKGWLAYLPAK